jgi:hypothetical protein
MSVIIREGWLQGHCIRRARKAHRCVCCGTNIPPGEAYAEGEGNDDAGGYGNDRFCLPCAKAMRRGQLLQPAAPSQRVTA